MKNQNPTILVHEQVRIIILKSYVSLQNNNNSIEQNRCAPIDPSQSFSEFGEQEPMLHTIIVDPKPQNEFSKILTTNYSSSLVSKSSSKSPLLDGSKLKKISLSKYRQKQQQINVEQQKTQYNISHLEKDFVKQQDQSVEIQAELSQIPQDKDDMDIKTNVTYEFVITLMDQVLLQPIGQENRSQQSNRNFENTLDLLEEIQSNESNKNQKIPEKIVEILKKQQEQRIDQFQKRQQQRMDQFQKRLEQKFDGFSLNLDQKINKIISSNDQMKVSIRKMETSVYQMNGYMQKMLKEISNMSRVIESKFMPTNHSNQEHSQNIKKTVKIEQ